MFDLIKDLAKLRSLFERKDQRAFILLFVLMLCGSVLEAIGIGAIPAFVSLIMSPRTLAENQWVGQWFRNMPEEITTDILLWASGGLMVFMIVKNAFLAFVFYMQAKIVTRQQTKLGDKMFGVYQSAPYEWHLQRSSSELLRNIQNDTAQVLRGILLPFMDLIMALMMTAVVTIVLIYSMPAPALLSFLVIGAGLFAVIRLFQGRLRQLGKVVWSEHQGITKSIQQGFGALADARIFGCEGYLRNVHHQSLRRSSLAQRAQLTIQKSTQYAIETIAVMGLLLILLLLVQTADTLAEILPIVVLMGVATLRLKQFATRIAATINQMNAARAFIPRFINDYHELAGAQTGNVSDEIFVSESAPFKQMKLKGVTYTYPNAESPAVIDISLEIGQGESIGFVGKTGCGKSTLINLILGLLMPQNGQITRNDTNIQDDLRGWQSHLGYIPQSVFLLDDSIRANIAFGVAEDDVDEAQLKSVLELARLHDFVGNLPEGDQTIIGERGVRLSGGQRQRIGIARALYFDPEIFIMDEATSALDNKTEAEVMLAINNAKRGRTTVIIAHRLSTVKKCDRLYMMDEGRILVSGSYEYLIKRSKKFRDLVAASVVEN